MILKCDLLFCFSKKKSCGQKKNWGRPSTNWSPEPLKRLESGQIRDQKWTQHPQNRRIPCLEPLEYTFADPDPEPGSAVGSGFDPSVRPHGLWLLFQTPRIMINSLGGASPGCILLTQKKGVSNANDILSGSSGFLREVQVQRCYPGNVNPIHWLRGW